MTLIERLEALSGPNFAIEQEIVRIVNPQATRLTTSPPYTASIDAALTLVPEGNEGAGVEWNVESWTGNGIHAPHIRATAWVAGAKRAYGATPAIALCIASLRARSADNG